MSRTHRHALAFAWCATTLTASAQQDGQFLDAPMLAVAGFDQRMNALFDYDGDGWTDAVGTWMAKSDTASVSIQRNDGSGRLRPFWSTSFAENANNATNPFPVECADFDSDGLDDFAVGLRQTLRVYRSNGATAPSLHHSIGMGSGNEIQSLVLGDFDGNGTTDAAVRLRDLATGVDRGLRIYNKLFTVTPTVSINLVVPLATGHEMHAANCNGDGVVDLVCIGAVRVDFFSVSGSAVVLAGAHAHAFANIPMGAVGDIDGDSDEDVVLFTIGGLHRVLRRTGPTSYVFDAVLPGGPATELADIDGDGDLDGVCCGGGGGGPTDFSNSAISFFEIAKNDGSGLFAPSYELPSIGSNRIAGVDDIDLDGDNDMVAGLVVYYNVDNYNPPRYELYASNWVSPWDVNDLDHDGDFDLRATLSQYERNNGNGTFTLVNRIVPQPPAGSAFLSQGHVVDVDGDGHQDYVVTETIGGVSTRERFLRNNGGGGLVDGGPLTANGVLFNVAVNYDGSLRACDVNGDGFRDILAYQYAFSSFSPSFKIYLGDGTGLVTYNGVQINEPICTIADVDGDGRDDILVVQQQGVVIRWGNSAGDLTATTALTPSNSGNWPNGDVATVADLDNDGDNDVLVGIAPDANLYYAKTPRICEQLSSRSFAFHDNALGGYVGAMSPTIARDIDLDGDLDLLLGQRWEQGYYPMQTAMTVFKRENGSGFVFSNVGDQWPLTVTDMRDFDGDGDDDLVAYGSWKYVMFNRTKQGPEAGVRRQYGAATAGGYGQKPTFGAKGPFVGGGAAELRISGCAENAAGILLVGIDDQQAKLGATGGYVVTLPIIAAISLVFPGPAGVIGGGGITIPYTVPLAAVGLSWFHQAVVIDAGAQGGAAVSNGLELYYGP